MFNCFDQFSRIDTNDKIWTLLVCKCQLMCTCKEWTPACWLDVSLSIIWNLVIYWGINYPIYRLLVIKSNLESLKAIDASKVQYSTEIQSPNTNKYSMLRNKLISQGWYSALKNLTFIFWKKSIYDHER